MMLRFTEQSLYEVRAALMSACQKLKSGDVLSFQVVDPDLSEGLCSGEWREEQGLKYRYRGYHTWMDLAEVLGCRFMTPTAADPPFVTQRFRILDPSRTWHSMISEDPTEKYGTGSPFARIDKLEEPHFLNDYQTALARVKLPFGANVLDLGVNQGDELAALTPILGEEHARSLLKTGVDHCGSAIAAAREKLDSSDFRFIQGDINKFEDFGLPRQDLIISIGTLHCSGIFGKDLIIRLRKNLLKPGGAFILGFPNVRYVDGSLRYGAKLKNYREPELSLLVKDLFYYRRYLQQSGFLVTLTGKYYVFLTAISSPPA